MVSTLGRVEDEALLVARAVAGDRDSFHSLYRHHVSTVFGFLCNRVGPQSAEDLTAETFCRAFAHIGDYESRGVPFRAWLLRIAFHLVVGQSRSKVSDEVPYDDANGTTTRSHEDLVISKLEGDDVIRSFAAIPPSHQTVLDLRFLRELSVREAASVLDMSESGVRSLTYRALESLRDAHLSRSRNGARRQEETAWKLH